MPLAQQTRSQMFLVVRAAGDPPALIAPIRERLRQLDPKVPLAEPKTMATIVDNATSDSRVIALALGLFSVVALGVVLVGLFSVLEYYVRQRHREIGVRMAMGANTSTIAGRCSAAAWAWWRQASRQGSSAPCSPPALRALLDETAPTDPVVLVATPLLFGLTAIAACLLPAWRATTVSPVEALRAD